MGVAVGDYNNDGSDDILVLNLMREGASLFQNDGHGNFTDVSLKTGIHALTFPYTGFGAGWLDFDNDGWLDLFLANGAVTLREEQRGQALSISGAQSTAPQSGRSGPLHGRSGDKASAVFAQLGVSRGAAFGDIDNDGAIDILVAINNGPARILRNNLPSRAWLAVQIDGPGLGIGARVAVKTKGFSELWRSVHTDSSYLSASDPRVHFGLRGATQIEHVIVYWPDGSQSKYSGDAVKVNSVLHVPTR